jgi:hypothetical protein
MCHQVLQALKKLNRKYAESIFQLASLFLCTPSPDQLVGFFSTYREIIFFFQLSIVSESTYCNLPRLCEMKTTSNNSTSWENFVSTCMYRMYRHFKINCNPFWFKSQVDFVTFLFYQTK